MKIREKKILKVFIMTMKIYFYIYTLIKDLVLTFKLRETANFNLLKVFFSCNPLFIDSNTFMINLSRKT